MERLTTYEPVEGGIPFVTVENEQDALQRLAAYEDIELTPEEIVATLMNYISFLSEMTGGRMSKTNYTVEAMVSVANDRFQSICDECREDKHATELLDAEADGRLVVLPCKVGDTVYRIDPGNYSSGWKPFVREGAVTEISIKTRNKKLSHAIIVYWSYAVNSWYAFSSIGKTVFLTREEAEAALKGEGNG